MRANNSSRAPLMLLQREFRVRWSMTELRVLAIAREVKEEVNNLLDTSRRPLIDAGQLRDAVNGISANTNRKARRVMERTYWRLHNRLAVIVKMLNRLMGE